MTLGQSRKQRQAIAGCLTHSRRFVWTRALVLRLCLALLGVSNPFVDEQNRSRLAEAAEAASTPDRQRACHKLPRVEVQFVCRTMRSPAVNATQLVRDFYASEIFVPLTPQSRITYDLTLYVSGSYGRVEDVDSREWYYDQCGLGGTDKTLVTLDARGYYHWEEFPTNDSNSTATNGSSPSQKRQHSQNIPLFRDHSEHIGLEEILEVYLQSNVCEGDALTFYQAHIREWNNHSFPIPGPSVDRSCGTVLPPLDFNESLLDASRYNPHYYQNAQARDWGAYVPYPSSSVDADSSCCLRYLSPACCLEQPSDNNVHPSCRPIPKELWNDCWMRRKVDQGYSYDHDLYLLCGGDTVMGEGEDDISTPYLVLAVVAGYIMLYMIKAEFSRPLRRRPRAGRSRNLHHWTGDASSLEEAASAENEEDGEHSDSSSNSQSSSDVDTTDEGEAPVGIRHGRFRTGRRLRMGRLRLAPARSQPPRREVELASLAQSGGSSNSGSSASAELT